jgi:hypothetical protein
MICCQLNFIDPRKDSVAKLCSEGDDLSGLMPGSQKKTKCYYVKEMKAILA